MDVLLSGKVLADEPNGRFAFGVNWVRFLRLVDWDRIKAAEYGLNSHLGDLKDKTFLDIGSGSGLFSLAARLLGARVRSFDFDMAAVACNGSIGR